jgi:hypothetical protein
MNRHIDPATRDAVLQTEGTSREVAARLGVSASLVSRLRAAAPAVAEPALRGRGRPRLAAPSTATRQQRRWRDRVAADRGAHVESSTTKCDLAPADRTQLKVANDTGDDLRTIRHTSALCTNCGRPLTSHTKRSDGWGYAPCGGA